MKRPTATLRNTFLLPIVLASVAGCHGERSPEQTVRRFHEAAAAGDWDTAESFIDLDAKSRRMFSNLYDAGTDEERADTQRILAARLRDVVARDLQRYFAGGPGDFVTGDTLDNIVEVTQSKGRISLVFVLERRAAGWIIVDRIHELDGVRPSLALGVSAILSAVRKEIGREPTLADVNTRLDDLLGRVRVRSLRVGGPAAGR